MAETHATLLDQAKSLIYEDRHDAYGEYTTNAENLAQMLSIVLGFPVQRAQVPLILCVVKLSRLANDPTHTDSWVDLAGYAGLAGKLPEVYP